MGQVAFPFDALAGLETVPAGHDHVQQNQVGMGLPGGGQCSFAIIRQQYGIPFPLQDFVQHGQINQTVVYNQNSAFVRHPRWLVTGL